MTRGRLASGGARAAVLSAACLAIGLPGTLGLALGHAPSDWPVPFGLQMLGDLSFRTVVYFSGFLFFFGGIGLAASLARSGGSLRPEPSAEQGATALDPRASPGLRAVRRERPPLMPERGSGVTSRDVGAPHFSAGGNAGNSEGESRPIPGDRVEGSRSLAGGDAERRAEPGVTGRNDAAASHTTRGGEDEPRESGPQEIAPESGVAAETGLPPFEPFYGFLPRAAQESLSHRTGYQPMLFTKISILLSAAIGILLAGSWEIESGAQPLPAGAAARILIGLYLIAESVHRYIRFARGEPTGTLVGGVLYRLGALLWPRPS